MPCAICHDFQRKQREHSENDKDSENDEGEGERNVEVERFSWAALKTRAVSCSTCEILVQGCTGILRKNGVGEEDIIYGGLRFMYPSSSEVSSDEDQGEADDDDEDDDDEDEPQDLEKRITFHLANGECLEIEMFASEDETSENSGSSHCVWEFNPTRSRTCQQTDSAMALATIKQWISRCIVSDYAPYSSCEIPEYPPLPTRVVDVGLKSGTVKLVESKGRKAKYICLSHCWGREPINTTITSNLRSRTLQIPWDELTKTFQHAITLTRDLGIEYIWIDSLCIVQDSASDWEIESARMADIYSNSHLTIAATSSHDSRGGLFRSPSDIKVSGTRATGEPYNLYFREAIEHHIDNMGEATEKRYPLLTRAWVYQERMLSTRIVHFGRDELFFECKSGVSCECGYIAYHDTSMESQVLLLKIVYADAISGHDAVEFEEDLEAVHHHRMRLWRTLVSSYTNLFLTKSKDRLPAVGGMARQLSTIRGSAYVAGLWKDSLNEDLLWTVYSPRKRKSRESVLNAPSWSWASVETPVSYWDGIMFTTLDGPMVETVQPRDHFSKILRVSVTPSAIDEFGSIARGVLRISGLVVECTLQWDTELRNGQQVFCPYIQVGDNRLRVDADYCLDAEGHGFVESGTPVYCIRMSLLRNFERENLVSLVLRQSASHTNAYERIGIVRIAGPRNSVDPYGGGIFLNIPEQAITIV
ncbi:unnamed protein product [Periconia digitata]|uniref:Heterokaryon incompatibility domain-containing protein n=1 Tax=Periconia digitata TaxID=1303443 RepID=A0A9W4UM74_9PLEO|nr:unnamed protein product [Periconia digitata]